MPRSEAPPPQNPSAGSRARAELAPDVDVLVRASSGAAVTCPENAGDEPQVLRIDMRAQQRAMLDLLPTARSVDHETTEAWLSTIEVSNDAEERYEYPSPDGPDGCELGRGATGRVLLAKDKHLGRDVALKELLPELLASTSRQSAELRFVREARISGQLEHPNIVTVYDMGRRSNGQLYYTMKVVRGRTLQKAIANCRGLGERLALLGHISGLCQAIAYAHSNGVIHRDIKPENVMIGEFGETVVLDWGGARVAETAHNSNLLASIPPPAEKRRWIGTPLYMSPEQVAGKVSEIDERSDVWALGVVLYQVLTGRWPFEGKSFAELSHEIRQRQIRTVRGLQPDVEPALAAIAERALRKDPKERYPSAREMMRDIEAYRSGGKVRAYSYSVFELAKRYVARRRTIVAVAGVLSALAVVVALDGYRRLSVARSRADAETVEARKAERIFRQRLADSFVSHAIEKANAGDPVAARVFAGKALEIQERSDARGLAVAIGEQPGLRPAMVDAAPCTLAATSAVVGVWACAGADGLQVHSPGGTVTLAARVGPIRRLWMSGDGTRLISSDGQRVGVWDVSRAEEDGSRALSVAGAELCGVSADAKVVACADGMGTVRLLDATERALGVVDLNLAPESIAVNDSGRVCVGGRDGRVVCSSTPSHESEGSSPRRVIELVGHRARVVSLALAGDGRLVSAGADHSLLVWASPWQLDTQPAHRVVARDVGGAIALSDDARHVAYASTDRDVRLYDVLLDQFVDRLRPLHTPSELRWGHGSLLSVGDDGLETWVRAPGANRSPVGPNDRVVLTALVPSADGSTSLPFVIASDRRHGCLWDPATGACTSSVGPTPADIVTVAVHPSAPWVALGGRAGLLEVWDASSGARVRSLSGQLGDVDAVVFSRDGQRLVAAGGDRRVLAWGLESDEPVARAEVTTPVRRMLFASDGAHLALVLSDGSIEIRRGDLRYRTTLPTLAGTPTAIVFAADGQSLFSGSSDGQLLRWAATGAATSTPVADVRAPITDLATSPDGRWLVAATKASGIEVFELPAGRVTARIALQSGSPFGLRFDPSRRSFAMVGADGVLRLLAVSGFRESGGEIWKRTLDEHRLHLDENSRRLIPRRPRG